MINYLKGQKGKLYDESLCILIENDPLTDSSVTGLYDRDISDIVDEVSFFIDDFLSE